MLLHCTIRPRGRRLLFVAAALVSGSVQAAEPSRLAATIDTQAGTTRAAAASQQVVDTLNSETEQLLDEYRYALRQIESLEAYNAQVEKIVAAQASEIAGIEAQLAELETTNREVIPLMLKMITMLERILEADIPFLIEERTARVSGLREMMDRADISSSEKYRRVLEAYQVEVEYARTIEAYTGELEAFGSDRRVDFLRIGRVALYYQTLDGSEIGFFDPGTRQWSRLGKEYATAVRSGLQIARKQVAPDLLRLPLPAPSIVSDR
ncbi:DUF3450 domain-containing protein [Opitutales bacterium ASA1]|uniref:DUF3450 domain-containing protein n=1 Tax=Congregicoccus parvus TaxID=3081749 RepID=UPI002B2D22A0|nr:DUF3450 domain-containing protein [Opitutales bacterium ASA1]